MLNDNKALSISNPLGQDCIVMIKNSNRFIVFLITFIIQFLSHDFGVFPTLTASFAFMCSSLLLIINVAGNSVHLSFV